MPFSLSRVGVDTAQLNDTDLTYIDTRIVETVRQKFIARQLFSPTPLPNAGIKTWTVKTLTDMSEARLDMDGYGAATDRTKKTDHSVSVPVLHKDYFLPWRDVIASRAAGMPIDTTDPENAAIKVGELEDLLCLSGEYSGKRMLGIEGLLSATGRNTEASAGAWSTTTNAIQDIIDAIAELEADGHNGPYDAVVTSAMMANLRLPVTNTASSALKYIKENGIRDVFASDRLYVAGDGGTDSALVLEPGPDNFELGIAQEVTNFVWQDKDMNSLGKVYEVVVPHIKRATSICEITGIT